MRYTLKGQLQMRSMIWSGQVVGLVCSTLATCPQRHSFWSTRSLVNSQNEWLIKDDRMVSVCICVWHPIVKLCFRWGDVLHRTYLTAQQWNKFCIFYNQRDETYTIFFITISALHVSGSFRPLSGAYKTVCAALGIVMRSCCLPPVWMGSNSPTPAVGSRKTL